MRRSSASKGAEAEEYIDSESIEYGRWVRLLARRDGYVTGPAGDCHVGGDCRSEGGGTSTGAAMT